MTVIKSSIEFIEGKKGTILNFIAVD